MLLKYLNKWIARFNIKKKNNDIKILNFENLNFKKWSNMKLCALKSSHCLLIINLFNIEWIFNCISKISLRYLLLFKIVLVCAWLCCIESTLHHKLEAHLSLHCSPMHSYNLCSIKSIFSEEIFLLISHMVIFIPLK